MPIRIYDDQRLTKDVTYFGNQWTTTVRDNAYLGTVLECDATNVVNATGQDAPYLEMTFRGMFLFCDFTFFHPHQSD